jgi:hypothetical protein
MKQEGCYAWLAYTDLEVGGHELLSQHLSGEIEETYETP